METIADVLRYIKSRAALAKEGEWVVLTQVFITRLRDQRFPTRAELDAAAPHNPVYFGTSPDASLNSMALKLSGIDKNFKITDGKPGRIERTADGEPTGIIRSGSRRVQVHSGDKIPTADDRLRRLKMLLGDYNSVGLTSISERDLDDAGIDLYRRLRDAGELNCRVYVMYSVDAQSPVDEIERRMLAAAQSDLHRYNNMLWVRGIKTYMDGGMLTGSAYMLQPWGVSKVYSIDDPQYRGMRYIDAAKLYRIARFALKNDLQYTAHSVGDGAVQAMIDAYSETITSFRLVRRGRALRMRPSSPPAAIEKIRALGIVLDLQPGWLWLDGATLVKQFGYERMAGFQPYKSLFNAGIPVGGGPTTCRKSAACDRSIPIIRFSGCGSHSCGSRAGRTSSYIPNSALPASKPFASTPSTMPS